MQSDPTDLDALIHRYRDAVLSRSGGLAFGIRDSLDEKRLADAEAALRARLAPTVKPFDEVSDDHFRHTMDTMTERAAGFAKMVSKPPHADDEALLSAAAYSVHPEDIRRAWSGIAQRLAELRARAETAERELAECRDRTIEECAAVADKWHANGTAKEIRALKKEPRDA